ncbi:unnamed protein product [Rhodiola kirilowii]
MSFLLSCFILLTISSISNAVVPAENQFVYTCIGVFGDHIVEYDGNYVHSNIFNAPFQLMYYNTTPNAFTLAIRMGLTRTESPRRWTWEANRGNPVGLNSNLTFGSDGNLVLTDATDGRVAWQTNTANKGVTGFSLLPNGNMVLYNSNGSYVWQSFVSRPAHLAEAPEACPLRPRLLPGARGFSFAPGVSSANSSLLGWPTWPFSTNKKRRFSLGSRSFHWTHGARRCNLGKYPTDGFAS